MGKRDIFSNSWIIENSIEILKEYEAGDITIRGLHYQLVGIGMTNSDKHYNRVVKAMIQARWDKDVSFEAFSDHDRDTLGDTRYEENNPEDDAELAIEEIGNWADHYYKDRWSNQEYYPEVWIEKKALQGVFEKVCMMNRVLLAPCKGYPSLTFLNEAFHRFEDAIAKGKKPVILYFGDHDPSGDDIPNSIVKNLRNLGITVELRREALTKEQAIKWELPPAPVKKTDSRAKNWNGIGQVELDAVKPKKLKKLCQKSIDNLFDGHLYGDLLAAQETEAIRYKEIIKNYFIKEFGNE